MLIHIDEQQRERCCKRGSVLGVMYDCVDSQNTYIKHSRDIRAAKNAIYYRYIIIFLSDFFVANKYIKAT